MNNTNQEGTPKKAKRAITPNGFTKLLVKSMCNVLKNGRDMPDGQGGILRVQPSAKDFEAAMKLNDKLGGVLEDPVLTANFRQRLMEQSTQRRLAEPAPQFNIKSPDDAEIADQQQDACNAE
jgi:hypothetical protein